MNKTIDYTKLSKEQKRELQANREREGLNALRAQNAGNAGRSSFDLEWEGKRKAIFGLTIPELNPLIDNIRGILQKGTRIDSFGNEKVLTQDERQMLRESSTYAHRVILAIRGEDPYKAAEGFNSQPDTYFASGGRVKYGPETATGDKTPQQYVIEYEAHEKSMRDKAKFESDPEKKAEFLRMADDAGAKKSRLQTNVDYVKAGGDRYAAIKTLEKELRDGQHQFGSEEERRITGEIEALEAEKHGASKTQVFAEKTRDNQMGNPGGRMNPGRGY